MRIQADALLLDKDTPANYTLKELDDVLIKYEIKSASQLDYVLSKVDLTNLDNAKLWETATEIACETLNNFQRISGIMSTDKIIDKNFLYESAKRRRSIENH